MIKYIKYIYIFKFKKKILKLVWIIVAKFYLQNNSKNVKEIIKKNRKHLAKQVDLISLDEYSKNNYGIPKKNYHLINKPINNNLINIDLIVYILKNMNLAKINYLEIGASVLKTFMTINNSVSNINQTAYDINPLIKKYDKNFYDKAEIRLDNFLNKSGSLFIASHSKELLRKFCLRGIVFSSGKLVFDGDIEEALIFYDKVNY